MLRLITVSLAAVLLGTLVKWVVPDPWEVWLSIGLVFILLLWQISRLEDRIDDLEYALVIRDREVFTEKQWEELNTRYAHIYELIRYEPLADLGRGRSAGEKPNPR
jgi:hypothetical protein